MQDWTKMKDDISGLPNFNSGTLSVDKNKAENEVVEKEIKKPNKKSIEEQQRKDKEDFQKTLDNEISKLNKTPPSTTNASPRGSRGRRGSGTRNYNTRGHQHRAFKSAPPPSNWTSRTYSDKQTSPIWQTGIGSVEEKDSLKVAIPNAVLCKDGQLRRDDNGPLNMNTKDLFNDILCKNLGTLTLGNSIAAQYLKDFLPNMDGQLLMPVYVIDKNDPMAQNIESGWNFVQLVSSENDDHSDELANNIVNHIFDEHTPTNSLK